MLHDGTEGKGVSYVDYVIRSRLDWIFRDQRVDDRGIDGQIEACANRHALGRLIAVQIKAGPSYFEETNGEGWVFRDSLDHLGYFLNHSLPVIVVLCDLDSDPPVAYWQRVSIQTIEKTKKGWKLSVPRRNVLDKAAKADLRIIAQPTPRALLALRALEARINRQSYDAQFRPRSADWLVFLLQALVGASQSIYFAAPLVSPEIIWAMRAVALYVRVQGVIGIEHPAVIEELRAAEQDTPNLVVRYSAGLHAKLVVVDGVLAISGSANLTQSSLRSGEEVVMTSITRRSLNGCWIRSGKSGQRATECRKADGKHPAVAPSPSNTFGVTSWG